MEDDIVYYVSTVAKGQKVQKTSLYVLIYVENSARGMHMEVESEGGRLTVGLNKPTLYCPLIPLFPSPLMCSKCVPKPRKLILS